MNVITSRPIYSNAGGAEEKALRDAERLRIKNERLADREKLKAERDARLASGKLERQTNRTNRKANRNAKRLLRLKNKQGREQILYPLTRLRRNKENKLVKVYPDGTETIVKPEMVVQVKTVEITPAGPVTKIVEVDKAEVAEALKVPVETITPIFMEEKKIEIPVTQAPIQAEETKVTGLENVIAVEIKPEDIVTDPNGNDFVSTQTTGAEEPIVDVVDVNINEVKTGMSVGLKIGIGVGIVVVLGLVGYMIYRSSKGNK